MTMLNLHQGNANLGVAKQRQVWGWRPDDQLGTFSATGDARTLQAAKTAAYPLPGEMGSLKGLDGYQHGKSQTLRSRKLSLLDNCFLARYPGPIDYAFTNSKLLIDLRNYLLTTASALKGKGKRR